MSKEFNISEILEIAMKIEQNGKSFYDQYSELTQSEDIKAAFISLSDQEKHHYEIYEQIRNNLNALEAKQGFPGDANLYLNSLAEEAVFDEDSQADKLITKIKTDLDALEMALGMEYKSIDFYSTMKNHVTFSDRRLIDEVIAEERKHVERINNMKLNIQST